MFRKGYLTGFTLVWALFLVGLFVFITHPAKAQLLSGQQALRLGSERAGIEMAYPTGPKAGVGSQGKIPMRAGRQANSDRLDPSCWTLVPSPNPSGGAGFTLLTSVSAVSHNDVWAVGNACTDCGTENERQQTLIEHWNGTAWSVVPSPNVGDSDNILSSVVTFGRKDAWAVGDYWDGARFQTLTLHYDGNSWSVVPSPNPGSLNNYLNGVAGTSAHDVWAVGTYRIPGGPLATLVEHFDGYAWSVVPSASPGLGRNVLDQVTALSPNNAWANGIACDDNGCTENGRGLILHWDGRTWSEITSPNPGSGVTYHQSISASNPNDIWSVGWYCVDSDCTSSDLFVEHYDGKAWTVQETHPFPGSEFSAYWAVLALNPKDAWIGGSYSADGQTWTNLLRHWDGTNWTTVPVSSPGAYNNDVNSLSAVNRNDIWAVGDADSGPDVPQGAPLTEHYDGPCH